MRKIKEKDFVELEYTGKVKEDSTIFDTTDLDTAKKAGIFDKNRTYGPITISIGQGFILAGLDKKLIGCEEGKSCTIELDQEDGFGRKSAKLLQLVPMSAFKKENINPVPGLSINVDNIKGVVKTVTGGRVIVDFNHPLSGKDLVYTVTIKRIVTDITAQVRSLIAILLGIKDELYNVAEDNTGKVTITFKRKIGLKDEFIKSLTEKITELTGKKDIVFIEEEKK